MQGQGAARSIARAIAIVILCGAALILSLRSASASAGPDSVLYAMRPWFAGHSTMIADRAMAAVGQGARTGTVLSAEARGSLARLSVKEPLRPEPFLVAGAEAQVAGAASRGERLFLAARSRDPRSVAARYFLADRYFRTGRVEAGLVEMAALARLQHGASRPFIPAVAAFARTRGAAARLKRFFALSPDNRDPVLLELARDPDNLALLLDLAPSLPVSSAGPYPEWQVAIVNALLSARKTGEALRAWTLLSGIRRKPDVVDPHFRSLPVPPPFAWTFTASSAGVAEPRNGGGLDVIYYGREPAELARQILTLAPGRYHFRAKVVGPSDAAGLGWRLDCLNGRKIAGFPLGIASEFELAGDCPAQTLLLTGTPQELPRTINLTASDVSIRRVGG